MIAFFAIVALVIWLLVRPYNIDKKMQAIVLSADTLEEIDQITVTVTGKVKRNTEYFGGELSVGGQAFELSSKFTKFSSDDSLNGKRIFVQEFSQDDAEDKQTKVEMWGYRMNCILVYLRDEDTEDYDEDVVIVAPAANTQKAMDMLEKYGKFDFSYLTQMLNN